jgi:hypothetical protein
MQAALQAEGLYFDTCLHGLQQCPADPAAWAYMYEGPVEHHPDVVAHIKVCMPAGIARLAAERLQ